MDFFVWRNSESMKFKMINLKVRGLIFYNDKFIRVFFLDFLELFFFFFLVNKHLWTFLPNCIFLSWKITIISLNVLLFNMQFFLLFLKIKKKKKWHFAPSREVFFSLNMNYRFKKIKGRVSFSKMRGERYHFLKP